MQLLQLQQQLWQQQLFNSSSFCMILCQIFLGHFADYLQTFFQFLCRYSADIRSEYLQACYSLLFQTLCRLYADILQTSCKFCQVSWRQYTDSQMAFRRYLADIFSGTFVDSLHAFCRLFTEFLKAFCRLFADNLHAVQTFHRLIVIRTCNGLTVWRLLWISFYLICS